MIVIEIWPFGEYGAQMHQTNCFQNSPDFSPQQNSLNSLAMGLELQDGLNSRISLAVWCADSWIPVK